MNPVASQSALAPGGALAADALRLWHVAFAIGAFVWVIVVAALVAAVIAARRRRAVRQDAATERRLTWIVSVSVALSVAVLLAWFVASITTGDAMTTPPGRPGVPPLAIDVIAHQWWWEVQYPSAIASDRVVTANEIHIPVGRAVLVTLSSVDVIHSFWVPGLNGKRDAIPGYVTRTWLEADRPGTFRGQCAEFCGHQHAKMALLVIAESPARFAGWLAAQRLPARPPTGRVAQRGEQVFLHARCMLCHRIDGTTAGGEAGPDLTHLASRRTLAAATLPNSRGSLEGWIVDPQAVKPGAAMPPNHLPARDLNALAAYLETLY